MKINKSGAALSRIVQIGETLKELSQKSGKEYLPLNRCESSGKYRLDRSREINKL